MSAQSLELFAAFPRIERLGAAGKALCARQMAASQAWFSTGHRSPCHLMAEATGASVRHAVDLLEAAEAMRRLPATEDRFRSGALTERQAIEVATAAVADPSSEAELLELAEAESFPELQRAAARVRAAATDDDERHRRAHRRRHLRHWVDLEGSFRFSGSLTPEAGAIAAGRPSSPTARPSPDGRPKSDGAGAPSGGTADAAVAADALVEMARAATASQPADPCGPPSAMIHVRVDHAALGGDTPSGARCARCRGWDRSPWAGSRACWPTPSWRPCEVDDGEVLKVAHLGRGIPARVRTALVERDRACVVPGCARRHRPGDRPHPPGRRRRPQRAGQPVPAVPVPPLPQDPPRLAHLPAGQTLAVGGPPRPPSRPRARQPELAAAGR